MEFQSDVFTPYIVQLAIQKNWISLFSQLWYIIPEMDFFSKMIIKYFPTQFFEESRKTQVTDF